MTPLSIQPVNSWVLFITGFGQTGKFRTGLSRLEDHVYRSHASPSRRVELHGWQVDVKYLADRITHRPVGSDHPKVAIIGYSWGGATAVNLSEELNRRGVDVNLLGLCDAVSRGPIPIVSVRSILGPYISLIVPKNVLNLYSWRQECPGLTNLQGSRIIWEDHPDFRSTVSLNIPHVKMDDNAPNFHKVILQEIQDEILCDIL